MVDTSSNRKKQKRNDDNDGIASASLDEVKLVEDGVAVDDITAANEKEVGLVVVVVEVMVKDEVEVVEDDITALYKEEQVEVEVEVEVEVVEDDVTAPNEKEEVEVEVELAEDEEEEESVEDEEEVESVSSNSYYSYSSENNENNQDTDEKIVHTSDDYVNNYGWYPPAVKMLRGLPVHILDRIVRMMGREYQEHCGFHHLVNSRELIDFLEYNPCFGYCRCKRVEDDDRQDLLRRAAFEREHEINWADHYGSEDPATDFL